MTLYEEFWCAERSSRHTPADKMPHGTQSIKVNLKGLRTELLTGTARRQPPLKYTSFHSVQENNRFLMSE